MPRTAVSPQADEASGGEGEVYREGRMGFALGRGQAVCERMQSDTCEREISIALEIKSGTITCEDYCSNQYRKASRRLTREPVNAVFPPTTITSVPAGAQAPQRRPPIGKQELALRDATANS